MNSKINTLFDYIKQLCESDLDRIISFVLSIICVNQQSEEKPSCPYCNKTHVIKYGHKTGKQRFLCHDCKRTYMHSTNTIMSNCHYSQSVWTDFIRDTLYGVSLDKSAKKYGFSHQTAFNMRHKILMALQDLFENNPVLLSGIAELDETFVLDCYQGSQVPETAGRGARKHGAKAAKRGISNEYVAICTGIQRDGGVIAATVNRAKPSGKELDEIFRGHISREISVKEKERDEYLQKASCIVLISNVREEEQGNIELVQIYKGQQVVENSFRELKSPSMASVIYLKNPERIKALSMLLSLSLLIRAIIQYRMREGLKEFNNENPGVKLRAGWGGRTLENPTYRLLYEHSVNCYFEKEGVGIYSYAWSSVETRERVETLLNLMKITLNDLLE